MTPSSNVSASTPKQQTSPSMTPYLSRDQVRGKPKSAYRLRLEAMKPGEWIHILATEANRSSVSRCCSGLEGVYHTRRTLTGVKVWRLS